jgi:hypothetical protein
MPHAIARCTEYDNRARQSLEILFELNPGIESHNRIVFFSSGPGEKLPVANAAPAHIRRCKYFMRRKQQSQFVRQVLVEQELHQDAMDLA